jgi:hypothetical protein
MNMQESGLVCGYTTQDHLLIDLDNSSLWKAKQIAYMIMKEYPHIGDCLIVESSEKNHHLIFDAKLGWSTIHKIIMVLAGLEIVELNFAWVRELRHDLTLRISKKHYIDKTSEAPQILFLIPRPDHKRSVSYGIRKYLSTLEAFRQ